MTTFRAVVLTALILAPCFAVDTKTWVHREQADFEKGTLKNLSLRSDGRLTLAPKFTELFDASTSYLWALAADSKGTLYAGGGSPGASTAKLFALDQSRKSRVVAELPGLEIHAIAIDKQDRIYAATAPDGKVYRVTPDGKYSMFFDPKAKYIWSLAFSSKGDLLVATGDAGEVHRVKPDGQGAVFFRTEETHARSMMIDANDNVIVGTEPGGIVVRISPAGQGFVLYQSGKKEITALASAADGSLYVAAAGLKLPGVAIFAPSAITPVPAPSSAPGARPGLQPPPPAPSPFPQAPAGGSEVYRIGSDGYPQRMWTHPQEIVYAIGFDSSGQALLGTGNKGNIYRLDSELVSTLLTEAEPTQITAILNGSRGSLYAASSNVGKVFQIGPGLVSQGSYESEALDGSFYSYWGKARLKSEAAGVSVSTRSGNLDRPQKNWSAWSPLDPSGRVTSPAARFLQYRILLTAADSEIREVSVAYMPKNVPPVIQEIEITPPNFKHSASLNLTPSARSLTLPPLGQKRNTPQLVLDPASSSSASLQFAKGFLGVRWAANDANGDAMTTKIEIRGVQETEWKLLQDKVKEKQYSWDSAGFPDGEYSLRLTASDSPANPPDQALSISLESNRFTIDNTPPAISELAGVRSGSKLALKWKARDQRSVVDKAEYSLNGGEWVVVEPTTRLSDSLEHSYAVGVERAGETTVAVRVTDDYENVSVEKIVVR